ncbi:MAG: FecR domain-containing protein, partial [Deltaproteobacteria bacterium]|nr:FecR domain-containing protein [Deltaproteobacteria bacterium]
MKSKRSFIIGWIALCLVFAMPFSVAAAQEIGKVAKVRGTAHIVRKDVDRPIAVSVGMPVYLNDEVRTAAKSSLRIKLEDGSILTLGPKGHLQLSHFEFEPEKKKRSALFDMFRGKLRVFAKDHETYKKKDFKIKTPTAICGVRGTLFLVWVLSDEVTKVFCFKKEVGVANVYSPGEVVVLVPNYGTDVVLRNTPSQPAFTSPGQQHDAVKDLG